MNAYIRLQYLHSETTSLTRFKPTMKTDIRTLIRLSCFVSNTWDNLLLMPCAVCISEETNIKTSVWDSIYTNIWFHITLITYLIAILIKTDIVAIPRPLPETRIISTNSRLRLKYWPIINVAGSLVMATPIPKIKKDLLIAWHWR